MRVAVVVSVGYEPLDGLVDEILQVVASFSVEPVIVLATHEDMDPRGSEMAVTTARKYGSRVVVSLTRGGGSFSRAYLDGWRKGLELANLVVSMDADGAHNPQDLSRFLVPLLEGKHAVMASRFMPGAKNTFPVQRRVVSWLGTRLTNLILRPRQRLSDFTSGFEGLSAEVLRNLFEKHPTDSWVSVAEGPYHLQNTELRLKVLDLGYPILEVPISYGIRKRGKGLKLGYLVQALRGFTKIILVRSRGEWK